MFVSHTMPMRAPAPGPMTITLTLLPTHVAVVRLTGTAPVRCGSNRWHLVPIDHYITVSSQSPEPLLDAAEDMIRYNARGRERMLDFIVGMVLTDWVDPCAIPDGDDDPDIVVEGAD